MHPAFPFDPNEGGLASLQERRDTARRFTVTAMASAHGAEVAVCNYTRHFDRRSPMNALMAALLLLASAGSTGETDASAVGTTGAAGDGGLRVTAGLGAGSFGLVGAGRLLIVPPSTPWRFGVQGTAMTDLELFVTPNENFGALHVVAARELVPSGSTSALVFAGVGGAAMERRGRQLPSKGLLETRYESIHENLPSALVGVDLGLSFRRKIGISYHVGAEVGASNSFYWLLQFDIGSW